MLPLSVGQLPLLSWSLYEYSYEYILCQFYSFTVLAALSLGRYWQATSKAWATPSSKSKNACRKK